MANQGSAAIAESPSSAGAISPQEGKLRAAMVSECLKHTSGLNRVFQKYAKLGIHPDSIWVFKPGDAFGSSVFGVSVDVFSPSR